MANDEVRQAVADAVSTVTGLKGYPRRPAALNTGDGYPRWAGAERSDGFAFVNTWNVVVVLATDERKADEQADTVGYALAAALQDGDVLFVENIAPAVVASEAGDLYALMITGRSE